MPWSAHSAGSTGRALRCVRRQGGDPMNAEVSQLPEVTPVKKPLTEQEKYTLMWSHDEYRRCVPGAQVAEQFLRLAQPRRGSTVIDFGAGTGEGALLLTILSDALMQSPVKVHMLDFARNCLDEDVRNALQTQGHALEFTQHDLTQPAPISAPFGYCTDVMEHIPPEQVDLVLTNVLQAAQHVFFQISCVDDSCGVLIGEKLHLSVHPPSWWLKKFNDLDCTVHYWSAAKDGSSCIAYVTAWATGQEIVDKGELNIEEEHIRQNVRVNLSSRYQHFYFARRPDDVFRDNGFYKGMKPIDSPENRAALELLKTKVPDYGSPVPEHGDIWHLEGVQFGPFDEQYEPAIPEEGYEERNPKDEVRVGYWWGNSGLYKPFTLKEWEGALLKAGGELQRWQQVRPYEPNDIEVMIVGGGPSLNGQADKIKQMRTEGVKLITLNGAYHWALEQGLKVSAQVVVDARPFNARFTHPVQDETVYLIGSQCDPGVLEGLPHDRTYLWHTTAEMIRDILDEMSPNDEQGNPTWFGVPGGCTVLLRTIPLLKMLGYRKFHLFGCDSCVKEANNTGSEWRHYTHHAYSQPENDGVPLFPATVGGRVFQCTAWQIAQAQEFMSLIRIMGDMFEIEVHGDGLLGWILQHGAQLDIETEEAREDSER